MNQTKLWKVDWCENKTSAKGTSYMKATLTDESNAQVENVTIFSTFPNFANIRPGEKISGFLKENVYNGKTSFTLDVEKTQGWGKPTNVKAAQIEKFQEKKTDAINNFQDKKQEAIDHAAAFRDATLITSAYIGRFIGEVSQDRIKEVWENFYNFITNKQSLPF